MNSLSIVLQLLTSVISHILINIFIEDLFNFHGFSTGIWFQEPIKTLHHQHLRKVGMTKR